MDFGEVLTKAWKIIWKYKILWLFGIFASCSGGGGGGGGGGGSSSVNYSGNMGPGYYYDYQVEPWAVALIVAAAILLAIIVTVIVMAVSTFGRIGLIQGAKQADEDEDARLTFSSIFNGSKPFFWRILGLNLLICVGYFFIIMTMIILFIFMGLTICLLPLVCILVPILAIGLWVLAAFVEMANVAVVKEDLGVIEGLQRGWEVFRGNLVEMILMGLVLIFGGFIVGLILAIPMILTIIPLMMGIFAAIFGDSGALAASGVVIAGLCCVVYLPVLIVLSGIIRAYIGTAWTLTYLRLTQGPAEDEAVDLLPDEPIQPEPQPELVEEAGVEEEVPEPEDDKPADSGESLPEDF
jgi:hypothetical protein